MGGKVYCLLVMIAWLVEVPQRSRQLYRTIIGNEPENTIVNRPANSVKPNFTKSLRFNIYTFTINAVDSGRVRSAQIKAYRGELLLTNFSVRIDGAVVGAEVADLDNNRFPELYVYSASDGSGSFGRVYAWQFMPERKADIRLSNWQSPIARGYMGHDSLWVERTILCRKFPVYEPGDANAQPSGGYKMMRYKLRPVGDVYALIAE